MPDTEDLDAQEDQTPSVEDLIKQNQELQAERDRLKAHSDKLLTETKQAKEAREKARLEAEQAAREKAEKAKDFESLFKSSESEREKTKTELEALKSSIGKEKVGNAALKIATELAEGSNAELLSAFVERRLKYTDEGVKVTSENGDLTISTLEDLKKEFANDTRYASLLAGSKASGGGAPGANNGGGAAKEISRADFDAMSQKERQKFIKEGGRPVNYQT
jgi:seryl-tRNA synthetase